MSGPSPLGVIRRYRRSWRHLWPFLGASRSRLLVLAGGSVLAGLVEAALLALIASLASALSQGVSRVESSLGPIDLGAPIATVLWIGVALALFRALVQVWLAYLPAKASAEVMVEMRRSLFERFTGTSWAVQASERDGQFQSLMSMHVSNASQAITTLAQGVSAALMFLTLLASAFVLSVPTAVVLIGASLLLFLMLAPLARRLRRHARALTSESMEYSKGVQEIVLMAEEIQVFGASEAYRDTVERMSEQVRRPMLQTRFLARAVPVLFQSIAFLLLIVALGLVYLSGATAIAELGAVVLILVRSLTFGHQLQGAMTRMDELVPFMTRLRQAMDEYERNPRQDGEFPLGPVERLGMAEVRYSYVPGGEDVLKGISFEAHRGEAIGIVGPSGAGKSSLVQIMLRLRQPTDGMLRVNGADARRFTRADWQRRVAYVPQTPQLVYGTVADNIRFYRPEITDAQVEQAARRAHLHDEISTWPEGYQTIIGQRVSAISGGQRQRLCLARALAGSPDVLILDEPTSALDVRSEQAVQRSLEEIKGDVLLFLVAHRLSTLAICDRVMVVVDGRLEAIDEPAALLEHNAFYREVTQITQSQSVSSAIVGE